MLRSASISRSLATHLALTGLGMLGALAGCGATSVPSDPGTPTTGQVDTVFYEGFESGTLGQWQDGFDPAKHTVISDASLAVSGTHLLRVAIPANGDGGWLTRFFLPGYDSLHVRIHVRIDPSWQGGMKLLSLRGSRIDDKWSGFGNAGRCPTGTDFFGATVTLDGTYNPGPMRFYTYYPGMPGSSSGTCYGAGGEGTGAHYDAAQGPLSKGVWHTIDFWVRLNTPGQSDGEQRIWLDGQPWAEWTGMRFRTTTDLRLNSVQLNLSATTSTGGNVYFDDVLVTRQRLR